MKVQKYLMMLGLLASASAFAQAGNGAGNGGDDLEMESKIILSDIRNWVEKQGSSQLLGAPNDYAGAMLDVFQTGFTIE